MTKEEFENHLRDQEEIIIEQSEWKGNWVQTVILPSGEEIVRYVSQKEAK